MASTSLTELFLELAKIDGISGNEHAVAQHITGKLDALGLPWREDKANVGTEYNSGNIICEVNGGGEMVFLAHMDTARSTAGLTAIVTDDRIHTDGTTILGADDRAGCAALLHALSELAGEGLDSLAFTVAFTIREETDSLGAQKLELPKSVRMGVALDSSMRPGHFIHRSYGAKKFCISVHGKSAHSGIAPEKGINAIYLLARGLAPLPLGRVDEETTANIGLIRGGSAVNIVPDLAEADGEVRSLELGKIENTLDLFRQSVHEAVKIGGATFEFKEEWSFKPFHIQEDAEIYQRVDQTLQALELISIPSISAGGSDANELNERGIATLNLGIGAQNPHSTEESIMLADLAMVGRIAEALMKRCNRN